MISAKIIADSINKAGNRITTFELEYPRFIHSELMTHRLFSRNAMSSRAVPVQKMINQVLNNPAMPVRFGKNKPGMQDAGEYEKGIGKLDYSPETWWKISAANAAHWATGYAEAGYHKQVANRLLEPFQRMKTVLTATEFDNFWWLRLDVDADPTMYELAKKMKEAYDSSCPMKLQAGEWHTPYVFHDYIAADNTSFPSFIFNGYFVLDDNEQRIYLSKEEAKAVSASCCAQVSYRTLNSTKEKSLEIYDKLISGNKAHASPFEHQATPMQDEVVGDLFEDCINRDDYDTWEEGVTHMDRGGNLWSGNFKGWIQHRQLIPNNVVMD